MTAARRLVSASLLLQLLLSACCIPPAWGAQQSKHAYIYVNDATGFAQKEFPGHLEPHMSPDNLVRLWYNKAGDEVDVGQGKNMYVWVPDYSYQYDKWYYYNQQTQVSQWDVPHDMGWRRVTLDLDEL